LALQRVSPSFLLSQKGLAAVFQRIAVLMLMGKLLLVAPACSVNGASQATPSSSPSSQIRIAVSPSTSVLSASAQQQFTATVTGTSNSAVTWTATAGTIASNGGFTAPAANAGTQITITATSISDASQHASGLVTIEPPSKLQVSTTTLSAAIVNAQYSASLSASGGTPPYKWAVSSGTLPTGIGLLATTGALSGTSSQLGQFSFTVNVTDSASNSATQSLSMAVLSSSGCGNFDGPAELPCVYLNTTMADTPAPGPTVNVAAGGDLQTALNNATCGETIELQAGATYSAQYTFPAKSCDDQHWIVVRTNTPDANLPPEGTRMTPCYAGVASLPGRPAFPCNSPQKLLATVSYAGTGDGPVIFANGANHYRLLGLEITRAANDGHQVTALVVRVKDGTMNQIVLDRLYIHGTPTDDTRRGVDFSGGISMAVQDSYLSEFHCSVTDSCGDSQAVSGGTGDQPMGPYKIDDNFLEAACENILFGGSEATQTPADIEIRFNHFFKPMFWMEGQPGFQAPAFSVKNHFELKNAQRVLFDSNILEDTWGGFSQHGFSVLLTPKNQGTDSGNVCPSCQVTDVTIRFVMISHVGGAFVIGNSDSGTGGPGAPLAGERYSIHDVIADDINETTYSGHGTFAQIGTIAQPLLQDVEINHVTAFPDHVMFNVGGPDTVQMPGFIFSNSIVASGTSAVNSTGTGGNTNCAYHQVPITVITTCFAAYVFSPNAILGTTLPPSKWPSGNMFYSTDTIDFVNYNNGNGGDYHLLPTSPAIGAASDGTNLGANVDAVLTAISGVE
jgi:hypothetical protein